MVSGLQSTVTFLTLQTQQNGEHPVVTLNGAALPVEPKPKILRVTFDPAIHFQKYVENINQRAKPRFNILRLIYGIRLSQLKKTMLVT